MNEILKAIKERRSIRSFNKEIPDRELIDQVIEAGLYAASGKGLQSTKIICITNEELKKKITDDNRKIGGYEESFDPFYGAPVFIVVLADRNNPNNRYDGSLVMGNMMLAAHSLGLGSIWINRAYQEFETDEYKEMLKNYGIEGEWEGVAHLALGYVDGEYPPVKERKTDRVYYID